MPFADPRAEADRPGGRWLRVWSAHYGTQPLASPLPAYHGSVPPGRPVASAGPGRPRPRAWRFLLVLLAACHPEPAATVTILTSLLALAAGAGLRTLWIAAAVGAGQLGVGWSNDYLDRELDRAAGRADKPLAGSAAGQGEGAGADAATVRVAAVVALVAAVPLSLLVSTGFAIAHLLAVACALSYNAGLKARPLSVLPYAVAFGLLPVAVALGLPRPGAGTGPHWPPAWAVAASALAGAGGHFTQALPDIAADRALGIRGLPQLVGKRASALAAATLLLAANLTIALVAEVEPRALAALHTALAAALAAGILVATLEDRERLAFRLTLGSAALAVVAVVAGGGRL
jgi:4-hydroxybenzoate polyprenyltransferase